MPADEDLSVNSQAGFRVSSVHVYGDEIALCTRQRCSSHISSNCVLGFYGVYSVSVEAYDWCSKGCIESVAALCILVILIGCNCPVGDITPKGGSVH